MNGTFYHTGLHKTGFYQAAHTTFGGKIRFSDFNRKITMSEMADRIRSDQSFDEQCRKNMEKKQYREANGHEHNAAYTD